MNVDVEKALSPLRKLRKTLNDFPADPSPADVHDLRTRARRLEAILHALSPDSDRDARRLLKHAKPVRKVAGKVRDMDVLLAKLFALSDDAPGEDLLRLAGHLASLRKKHALRLRRILGRHGKRLGKLLKRYVRLIEQNSSSGHLVALSATQHLASDLEHAPPLNQKNLHEFRIQAKELRYMLQLAPQPDRQRLDALNQIKDAAGEWHDWKELLAVAKDVLDPKVDSRTLKDLDTLVRQKLRVALAAANRMRTIGMGASESA